MNIQEAKALALEAFKKELKEPGWELYEHGIAKGPWVAFPNEGGIEWKGSKYWYYKSAHILFQSETVAHGNDVPDYLIQMIEATIKEAREQKKQRKDTEFTAAIQHYLSKHPLEAP